MHYSFACLEKPNLSRWGVEGEELLRDLENEILEVFEVLKVFHSQLGLVPKGSQLLNSNYLYHT